MTPSSRLSQSMYKSAEKISPMKGNEEAHLVQALKQLILIDKEVEDLKC